MVIPQTLLRISSMQHCKFYFMCKLFSTFMGTLSIEIWVFRRTGKRKEKKKKPWEANLYTHLFFLFFASTSFLFHTYALTANHDHTKQKYRTKPRNLIQKHTLTISFDSKNQSTIDRNKKKINQVVWHTQPKSSRLQNTLNWALASFEKKDKL